MSDTYEAIVDLEVEPEAAEEVANRILERLIAEQIVMPEFDQEAVLGGEGGYRPGNKISELYQCEDGDGEFLTLATNGLEIEAKPWFNVFGMTCLDGIWCPKCNEKFESTDDFEGEFEKAVGQFYEGDQQPCVTCPTCEKISVVQDWKAQPHLGFANLAFVFWNWPPLNSSSWKIDLPKLIADVSGHNIVTTYGRV